MNPQNANQSQKPPPPAVPPGIRNPYVTPSSVAPATPPQAADYAYRIAALSAGIFLLVTLL